MIFSISPVLPLLRAALSEASIMAKASWRYGLAFIVAAAAGLVLKNAAGGGFGFAQIALILPGMALFCVWSYRAYQASGLGATDAKLVAGSAKLALAYGLVAMALFLIAFMLGLFLIIFSVVLVIGSGYDPSQGGADDVSGSVQALRESGAIYLLYAMLFVAVIGFCAGLVRLAVFAPATVDAHQIKIFQTWPWTKHKILSLSPAVLLLQIVPICMAIYFGRELRMYGDQAARAIGSGDAQLGTFLIGFGATAVQLCLWMPALMLGHGLAAAIYKREAPIK